MLDLGALTSGLVTGVREGVEAALIVAIVAAYLAKTGNARHLPRVLLGAAAAAAVSLAVGIAIFVVAGELSSPYEQLLEAATMVLAAGIVTWMLFWMKRQAAGFAGELQAQIAKALSEGSLWGLTALAFTAVIREGIETSVFLVGQVTAVRDVGTGAGVSVLLGALAGLAAAVGIGVVVYAGTRRVDLRSFFRWTGIVLVFIAAGLVSRAVHELIEIGVISVGAQVAFDTGGVLPEGSGIGLFLRALFGYSSAPEVVTLGVWASYVVGVLTLYVRPVRRAPSQAEAASAPSA